MVLTEDICDQNQKSCDMIHHHAAIKRYAARVTEANILNNPVRDSLGMYKVVKQKFESIALFHISKDEMNRLVAGRNIQDRFDRAQTIRGTRKIHQVDVDYSSKVLKIRTTSNAPDIKEVPLYLDQEEISDSEQI